ncbi:MAG: putative membrane-bound spermidine synthase [Bradymonadia bacterium]
MSGDTEPLEEAHKTSVGLLLIIAICMVLSGAAGLVYEVAWARMLGVFLGATAHAHAVVLSGFLGGLALGNWVLGKLVDRKPSRALLLYAVLELIIGVYGLLSPVIQAGFANAYASIAGGADPGPSLLALKLGVAFTFVLTPTMAMGGTLPALTRFLVSEIDEVGTTVSRLYLLNTLGAAVGCFLGGAILIPRLGTGGSVALAGVANLLIAAVAAVLYVRTRAPELDEHDGSSGGAPGPRRILFAAFAMGIATLTLEVTWTRIFSMVFGSSSQAFTLMLTAFIGGIAVGSAFTPTLLRRFRGRELKLLALLLLCAASVLALQMPWYEHLPYWQFKIAHVLERRPHVYPLYLFAQATLAFSWMLPLTIVTGAVLPVAAHVYTQRVDNAGASVGLLFTFNTMGNVLGPVIATFLLFPLLGLQGTLVVGIAGLGVAAFLIGSMTGWSKKIIIAGAIVTVVGVLPAQWEPSVMQAGGFRRWTLPHGATFAEFRESRLNSSTLFEHDSATDSVVVFQNREGLRFMKVNGKTDASDAEDLPTQRMVAHLPLMLHRAWTNATERDVYVVGVGSGVTVGSASIHDGVSVTAVEISPGVLQASRLFDHVNRNVHELPNVTIHQGDAREFLERSDVDWDVVINQPSNPWIAGNAALFSQQFYLAAREQLAEDGVFAQWMHVYAMDDETVSIVMNTFASVFPHVTVWWPQGVDLILIGSLAPLEPNLDVLAEQLANSDLAEEMAGYDREGLRVTTVDRFLALQIQSDAGFHEAFSAAPPFTTDLQPTLEFRAPVAQFVGARAELFVEIDERLQAGGDNYLYWSTLGYDLDLADLVGFFATRDTPFSEFLAGSLQHAVTGDAITPREFELLATRGTGLPVLLDDWATALAIRKDVEISDCSALMEMAQSVLPVRATALHRPVMQPFDDVVQHCVEAHPAAASFLSAMRAELHFACGYEAEARAMAEAVLAHPVPQLVHDSMTDLLAGQ